MLTRRQFLAGSGWLILSLAGADVLAARLLRGYVGNRAAGTVPPFDASWVQPSGALLSATLSWEGTAVVEACVLIDTQWVMYYRGGWTLGAVGRATCPLGSDPTVTANWTKAALPIAGQGYGGFGGNAEQPWVMRFGATYYCYVTGGDGNLWVTTLAGGTTPGAWTLGVALPSGVTQWGNRTVWYDGGWQMLQEGLLTSANVWRIWHLTSSDGVHWTVIPVTGGGAHGEYASLLAGGIGGATGGPRIASIAGVLTPKFGGLYHMWDHAVNGLGNLPTDIYHNTNADLTTDTWTITPATPVLTHTGSGFEIDQVAGPCPVTYNGTAYLFFDGDDNATSTAKIGVATAPAGY